MWPWVASIAVVAAIAFGAVFATRQPAALSPPTDASFVGSTACAACHRGPFDAWQRSQHARAMQPATSATVLGDFRDARFQHRGVDSMFSTRDGKFFVRTEGADGAPHDFEIKYTFGVEPLQQYLIQFPDGRLQALSIAWDTRPKAAGGARWFHLYPDETIRYDDELHWTRRAQNWNFMCADCHSVDVHKNYDAASKQFRTTWADMSVGCEGCHGPGSRHVEWARTPTKDPTLGLTVALDERRGITWSIDSATGNARRSRERRTDTEIEVCAQCHSRRAQIAEGYYAGKHFLDYYRPALLDPGLYYADGQQREEVYVWGSFLQSRMYRHGVTCSDCHEPHSAKLRADGNGLCARCHAAAKYEAAAHHHHTGDGAGTRCVDCHMPATTYMVIDPRRDHSLRIPRPDLTIGVGTPNACNGCHRDKSPQWAEDAMRAWYGHRPEGLQNYALAFAAAERGTADAAAALVAVARDTGQPPIARASALSRLAQLPPPNAIAVARQLAEHSDPLIRDASITALSNAGPSERWATLAPMLRDPLRSIRIDAAAALADAPAAQTDAAFAQAAAEYEASLRYTADRPESHVALATFNAGRGRIAEADAAFRAAIALDPRYAPAYVNYADMQRDTGRDADAERVLREGLAQMPNDATLHHALGLALVRLKRIPEALAEFARAAQLAPADARFSYVYAVALNDTGDTAAARREVDRGLAQHPDDRDLRAIAAAFRR